MLADSPTMEAGMIDRIAERDLQGFADAHWERAHEAARLTVAEPSRARAMAVRALAAAGTDRGRHPELAEIAIYRGLAAQLDRAGRRELGRILQVHVGLSAPLVADIVGAAPAVPDPAVLAAGYRSRVESGEVPAPSERELAAAARRLRDRSRLVAWGGGLGMVIVLVVAVLAVALHRPPPVPPAPAPVPDGFAGRPLVPFVDEGRLSAIGADGVRHDTDLRVRRVLGALGTRAVVLTDTVEVVEVRQGAAHPVSDWEEGRVDDALLAPDGSVLATYGDRFVIRGADASRDTSSGEMPAGRRLLAYDGTRWLSTDGRTVWLSHANGDLSSHAVVGATGGSLSGSAAVVTAGDNTIYLSGGDDNFISGPYGTLSPDGAWLATASIPGSGQILGELRIRQEGGRDAWTPAGADGLLAGTWWPDRSRLIAAVDRDGGRALIDCVIARQECVTIATDRDGQIRLPGW